VDLISYAELAVRLVNAGGGEAGDSRPDELASIESYQALMAGCDYPRGRVSPADLEALRQLRGELRLIFSACVDDAPEDAASRLNALLTRHPVHPQIARHDDRSWHLHHAPSGSVADQYAAGAVLGLTRVITELGADRLRRCEAAACPNSFVDLSAARSQGFCGDHGTAAAKVTALHERRRVTEAGQATTVAG
jgi:predicted RNA-binding Zn ribbon-like protein